MAVGATSVATLATGCLGSNTDEWSVNGNLAVDDAIQYQGPSCSCCDAYAEYLDDHLSGELRTETVDHVGAHQASRGVPPDLRSCHLVEIDGYMIVGHIPVKIIEELLETEPTLQGIALPGMPAGSPGMGGSKDGTWKIFGYADGAKRTIFDEF